MFKFYHNECLIPSEAMLKKAEAIIEDPFAKPEAEVKESTEVEEELTFVIDDALEDAEGNTVLSQAVWEQMGKVAKWNFEKDDDSDDEDKDDKKDSDKDDKDKDDEKSEKEDEDKDEDS